MSEKYDFDKLTSRDRVNYPYLLACRLLSIQEAEKSGDTLKIEGSILGFLSDIPDELRDQQFEKEQEESKYTVWIDERPMWCGHRAGTKIRKDTAVKDMPNPEHWKNYKNQEEIMKQNQFPKIFMDYDKLKHACINLLQRKNMLTRESQTEKFP